MENSIKEEAVFTIKQMVEMMNICRSWTLNNPSGPLPHLPICMKFAKNDSELYSTFPEYKKPNKIIDFLMKEKVI